MDLLLEQWLDTTSGTDALRTSVRTSLDAWKKLAPALQLEVAGSIEEHVDAMPPVWRERFSEELAAMETEWDKMRQAIADKHITLYERNNRVVGYVFCGAQNDDRMTIKWIVSGTPEFVEDYKNVQKEFEEQEFNKTYERLTEKTPYREIDALDAQFKEYRYQRVCKFSAPKKDSGWVKI